MSIYKGTIEFTDGRKFEDIWVNKEDAMSYYENVSKDNCVRAELFEMQPNENNLTYENVSCLYEFDVNGKYYYNVA